ncbi:hypothetical protein ACHAWO_004886 [Cyclotella atomus]|jgi:proline iminopeptidase|uniref:prolyl aminopeptidase n=1 Tax=Cyclotella atomus TaxID=382360 RepID=A0ABD3PBG8_9STRA
MMYQNADRFKKLEHKTSDVPLQTQQQGEGQPLMMRHISMQRGDDNRNNYYTSTYNWKKWFYDVRPRSRLLVAAAFIAIVMYASLHPRRDTEVISIERAIEHTIDIGGGLSIWFRTWGTHRRGYSSAPDAVPAVLFVHGGPGQAVADYKNGNKRFFDAKKLFVVEVDQRGTGNSQPSVRDDYRNMKYYQGVSIDLIAQDFEEVRKYLGIEEWAVWGGSYGSTIALNYCMIYPQSCTGLLLRGIYLDTPEELSQVYSREAFEDDDRKMAEFNTLYDFAKGYLERNAATGDEELDPNDAQGLLQAYEEMISHGDKQAIWTWHSFENNLMEDRPEMQLDPNVIVETKLPEAQNVAFFEVRLWLHGAFQQPSNLLDRVHRLSNIPIWMCQGVYDNVCPVQNAWNLVKALKKECHRHPRSDDPGYLQAYFLDANHEDTDPVMENCLKRIMNEFLEMMNDNEVK